MRRWFSPGELVWLGPSRIIPCYFLQTPNSEADSDAADDIRPGEYLVVIEDHVKDEAKRHNIILTKVFSKRGAGYVSHHVLESVLDPEWHFY